MIRSRFIVVNRESAIYRGMIYDRPFAEQAITQLREAWPGIDWEVEETHYQFPVPGLLHIGEVRAAKIMKSYLQMQGECRRNM